MRNPQIYLVLTLFFLSGLQALGAPLSLKNYLSRRLEVDSGAKAARQTFEAARAQSEASISPYQTTLTSDPLYGITNQKQAGSTAESKSFTAGANLIQKFPTATELSVGASRKWDLTTDNSPGLNVNDYSVALKQPLFQNSFGSWVRKQESYNRALLDQARFSWQSAQQEICIDSLQAYLDLYLDDQALELHREIAKTSEQVFQSRKRSFQKNLIRKIEYLGAEADLVKTREAIERVEKENSQKRFDFLTKAQLDSSSELQDPSAFFVTIESENRGLAETQDFRDPSLLALVAGESASASLWESSKDEARPTIDLLGKYRFQEGNQLSVVGIQPYEERSVQLGLQFSLPIWNRTLTAREAQTLAQWKASQLNLEKARRDVLIGFRETQNHLELQRSALQSSNRLVGIYKEQNDLALGDLNRGRINFEDYILVRDRMMNERIRAISLQSEVWMAELKIARTIGKLGVICESVD